MSCSLKRFLDRPAAFETIADCGLRNMKLYSPLPLCLSLAVQGEQFAFRVMVALVSPNFWRQQFFNRPAASQTAEEPIGMYAKFVRPLGQRLSLAVGCNSPVATRVVVLNGTIGPSTVRFGIMPVAVDPIDGLSRQRMFTGPRQKGCCIMAPLITDRDAAATIVFKGLSGWRVAALNHAKPSLIGASPIFAVFDSSFVSKATATLDFPAGQVATAHDPFFSAAAEFWIAENEPLVDRMTDLPSVFQNASASVLGTSSVYKTSVSWFSVGLSHLGTSIADLIRAVSEVRFVDGLFFYTRMEICSQ